MPVDEYTMKVPALERLFAAMRNIGTVAAVFKFDFGNVSCNAIFFIDEKPFRLSFVKNLTGDIFEIAVSSSFLAVYKSSEEQRLRDFFEVPRGHGVNLIFKRFTAAINEQAPTSCRSTLNLNERKMVATARRVEEADKIYICGFVDWDTINAEHGTVRGNRSESNKAKTRVLYPEVEKLIASRNISVRYTAEPMPLRIEHFNE